MQLGMRRLCGGKIINIGDALYFEYNFELRFVSVCDSGSMPKLIKSTQAQKAKKAKLSNLGSKKASGAAALKTRRPKKPTWDVRKGPLC